MIGLKLSGSLFVKVLSFCLMLIFAVGGLLCADVLYSMVNNLQVYKQEYRDTAICSNSIRADAERIDEYYALLHKQESDPPLSADESASLEQLQEQLFPPAGTNTAWILFSSVDQPVLTNIGGAGGATVGQLSDLTGGQYEQISLEDKTVVIGLRSDMPAEDSYSHGLEVFRTAKQWFAVLIVATVFLLLLFIVLFSFLVAAAGRKQNEEGIVLNPVDHIPLEVQMLLLLLFLLLGCWALFSDALTTVERSLPLYIALLGVTVPVFSFIRQAKTGGLYKTSVFYYFYRFCRSIFRHFQFMVRVVLVLIVFGLLQVALVFGIIGGSFLCSLLWFFSMIALFIVICIACIQYDRIRAAIKKMADGELELVIDEESVPFFRNIARDLNNSGKAMNLAVERSMESERMKTELITNVSHDIKTPLTSIISYVDLLKTTDITDPKALEYIDVLDRKSRRLGQLMVDLVEASKVNSGNVSVNMEVLNLGELVKQASGEFEPRMEERGIQLVCSVPEEPVNVFADGRHMWRVLDNLFSNAAKYALDGTRVYVDIVEIDQNIFLSVKNISRDPLNIRPQELMERFVRGDTARHTEGSGLGLSIARSLMELQHGTMNIVIDGDLFKVVLCLKKIAAPAPPFPDHKE